MPAASRSRKSLYAGSRALRGLSPVIKAYPGACDTLGTTGLTITSRPGSGQWPPGSGGRPSSGTRVRPAPVVTAANGAAHGPDGDRASAADCDVDPPTGTCCGASGPPAATPVARSH